MPNRTPHPGATALGARQICGELTRAVGVIGRHGISDWASVDVVAADFLLAVVSWETTPDGLGWALLLTEFNHVTHAVREAARELADHRGAEGEGWKNA